MLTERRHRRPSIYPAPPPRLRRIAALLAQRLPLARVALRIAVSLFVVGHLLLVALLPGGRNGLLGLDATRTAPHLTLLPVSDAFGFPGGQLGKGFILYKLYSQEGTIHEGIFPDPGIRPNLRFDRWAAAGNAVSVSDPDLHQVLLAYLLANLPSAPIKLELYSGKWLPGEETSRPGTDGRRPLYRLTLLGSHDGFTRAWQPTGSKAAQ